MNPNRDGCSQTHKIGCLYKQNIPLTILSTPPIPALPDWWAIIPKLCRWSHPNCQTEDWSIDCSCLWPSISGLVITWVGFLVGEAILVYDPSTVGSMAEAISILYTWYTCHMLWSCFFFFITLYGEKHFIHDLLSLIYIILTWYPGMLCCKCIVGCTWNHHWIGDLKLDPSIQPPVRSHAVLGTASEKGVVWPQIAFIDEK